MATSDKPQIDWIHLPAGIEATSLWDCLHDAKLRSVRSDAAAGSAVLSLDVPHLRKHHGLPEDLRFELHLHDVQSLRVAAYIWAPQLPVETPGAGQQEASGGSGPLQSRGREESLSWSEFEAAFPPLWLDIMDADLARSEEHVALRLEGYDEDSQWYKLFLRARALSARRCDEELFSLEQLMEMGSAYWEWFSQRRPELKQ